MFSGLEQILISYAGRIPLGVFSFSASFIEELIPPIPSPSIMITTGYLAQVQDYLFLGLILLAIAGSFGKTLGASVVYLVVDKMEDLLSGRVARFIGISHQQIESLGNRLSRSWKDYIILTILRALPVVPSSLLSVGCGFLKIRFRLFFISTFVGSVIRDFIYIYLGYAGTKVVTSLFMDTTTTIKTYVQIVVVLALVIFIAYLYFRRSRNKI